MRNGPITPSTPRFHGSAPYGEVMMLIFLISLTSVSAPIMTLMPSSLLRSSRSRSSFPFFSNAWRLLSLVMSESSGTPMNFEGRRSFQVDFPGAFPLHDPFEDVHDLSHQLRGRPPCPWPYPRISASSGRRTGPLRTSRSCSPSCRPAAQAAAPSSSVLTRRVWTIPAEVTNKTSIVFFESFTNSTSLKSM